MGKKLTAEEIGQHVIDNPSTGFDQCCKCQGVETQNSMKFKDEESPDFDLICDECAAEVRVWEVQVCRTATAFRTIKVIAATETEACDKAIDAAGDEEFGSGEAEYSAPNGAL